MPENAHLKCLSIHPDEKGKKVIACFAPAGATDAITVDVLMQAINAAGFGGYSMLQASIEEATAKYNCGDAFKIPVGEALDGRFSIRLDDNLMAAFLSCTLPIGGAQVLRTSILEEARLKGVTAALDLEAIDHALADGGNNIKIACGRPLVAGENGKFEALFPCMKEKNPHLDENGLADFRELGEIVTVQAGDKLMRIVAPTIGEAGETVTGKIVPVMPGQKVAFAAKLDGAIADSDDPDLLIAAISGCPVVLKDGVSVDQVYTVKDVDLRTGNISFSGTVHVSGDVHANMSVKASGDIYVDGTVENARLEAGGDIVVKGGIIGASELSANSNKKFQAAIKCDGSCTARFVQNAHISAESGIFIHDIAMLSVLTAGQQIIVGNENGRKGDIIGGIARAAMLVKARHVGSSAGLKTVVIAGADQNLRERTNAVVKEREALERKLAGVIKLLELNHLNPGLIPAQTAMTAVATRDAHNAEIEILRVEEIECNRVISLADGAQVIVEKHVFGGAEIRIGQEHYIATERREGGVFHISEDKLVFA
jgi:uncharacterized protein